MERYKFTATPDNPYYDYNNYIHESGMDSDDYFNDHIREVYQIKNNYFIVLNQLNFLEWEYEHRYSYLPSFGRKLKTFRSTMIIHCIIALIFLLFSDLVANYMFMDAPKINPMYPFITILVLSAPTNINALIKILRYSFHKGNPVPKFFAYKGLLSLAEEKAIYENELNALENEILSMRDLSDKLYDKAEPYLSTIDKKFMERDTPFDEVISEEFRLPNLVYMQRQLVDRIARLNKDLADVKLKQKRLRENSAMSWIAVVVSLFIYVVILVPFAPKQISASIMLLIIIPILFTSFNKIYDYYFNSYKGTLAEMEQDLLDLTHRMEDINEEIYVIEHSRLHSED